MSFKLADSNKSPLAAIIREAIGATPNEEVEITTPTFDRPAGWEPAMLPPPSTDGVTWAGFTHADRGTLRSWGCRPFCAFVTQPSPKQQLRGLNQQFWPVEDDEDAKATHELWLFPASWYEDIPNGFPIVDINGCTESFEKGKTDDDRRFGMLAYGMMVKL